MSQADFIKVQKGTARIVIKTARDDELPTFEIDFILTKQSATQLMIYAIQLKAAEDSRAKLTQEDKLEADLKNIIKEKK